MISQVNKLQIQTLKDRLNITSTLSLSYTTYLSGSNQIMERGYINQTGDGELKKEIVTMMTGSRGHTIIKLIYKDMETREPVIKTARI